MYKKSYQPTTPANSQNKKPNRNSQPLPIPDKKNESQSEFKNKDEQLLQLIRQHLLLNGYTRSHESLRVERPNLKAKAQIPNGHRNQPDKNMIMGQFDRGSRQDFFKSTSRMWNTDDNSRKVEFDLSVYFCIYNVHPHLKKQSTLDHANAAAFKKYLETKAPELELAQDQLILFSIPHMPKPQENPAFAHFFTKDFVTKTRIKLSQFLNNHLRSSNMSQQSSNLRKTSTLQEMYHAQISSSINSSREESKENCNHHTQLEALKQQNSELRTIIASYQKKFDQFAESSKQNLFDSNRKWFLFSREIFDIARRHMKEEGVKIIERYQSFFVGNIEDLIQANQISLFEKNSYTVQDLSMNPDLSKQKIQFKRQESNAITHLDLSKIKHLFLQANIPEKEIEILNVLKALKNRYNKNQNLTKRRQFIIEYSRGDIGGINEDNYVVQKRLFFDGGERIREFYVKLLEAITTDVLGLKYLRQSKKLVQNLVGLFGSQREDSRCFKPIVGILQRLSYCKQPRRQMIILGIIPMIFKIFRTEGEQISVFTLQFLTAMMMNLSLKKQSKSYFEDHKSELISIIIEHMTSEVTQVRDYINGSIYLLLTSQAIKEEAFHQKLDLIVKNLLETREEDMCSQQYTYILKRLRSEEEGEFVDDDSDEEEAEMEEGEDYDDEEIGSSASSEDYIEGEIEIAGGEEILIKNYALLGPQAVRQHILTRSVLDQTSKRLNNMTTSINRSRRLDNIFSQKGNATVLEPQLSALLNRKR